MMRLLLALVPAVAAWLAARAGILARSYRRHPGNLVLPIALVGPLLISWFVVMAQFDELQLASSVFGPISAGTKTLIVVLNTLAAGYLPLQEVRYRYRDAVAEILTEEGLSGWTIFSTTTER